MLKTKFGKAYKHKKGYMRISRGQYKNKYLHRLIWEDHYGKPVPAGYNLHHLNSVKTDNRIQNLQCVKISTHRRFHEKRKI